MVELRWREAIEVLNWHFTCTWPTHLQSSARKENTFANSKKAKLYIEPKTTMFPKTCTFLSNEKRMNCDEISGGRVESVR